MLKAFQYKKNDYNNIPLLLMLLGINHHQEPVYRTNGIPINQIIFCRSGQGQLILNKRKYIINEGQCFIILKDTPHEYHSTSADDWIVDIVGFNGAIVPTLLRTLKMISSGAYLLSRSDIPEKYLQDFLSLSSEKGKSANIMLSQRLYCFLTDLSPVIRTVASDGIDYGNPVIMQVIEYIESNYDKDISLDSLASVVNRTPEYLCKIFRQYTGSTPVNYINGIRLLHAEAMLVQEPSLPVSQIALCCGFRSPGYFGRVFSKQHGMSPGQYRIVSLT